MGPSPTSPALVDRAGLVVRVLVGPVGLAPVVPDRAVLDRLGLDPEGQVEAAVPNPVDPVDPVLIKGPVARADLVDQVVQAQVVPVGLDPVGRADRGISLVDPVDHPADRAHLAHPAGLVVPVRADPVDPAGRAMDRADPVVPVDRLGRVDPASPVIRADRHRPRTRPEALSTAVARRWAARGMCRTASARPVTVRRLHLQSTDGVGMAGPHPERRRPSGTDRRPRVAGTVHRLPVVGMSDGTGHRAIKASRSVISDRSITTGTTPFRCSTRYSGDGASGSSESGFRCTDTARNFTSFGPR